MNALEKGDRTMIDNTITELEFEELYIDYIYEMQESEDPLKYLENEISIVVSLIQALQIAEKDEDIIKILSLLNKRGYKIKLETIEKDIKEIDKKLSFKLQQLERAKTNIAVSKKETKNNIYELLAKLSIRLKFELNYETLTIIKFVHYVKALKEQSNE